MNKCQPPTQSFVCAYQPCRICHIAFVKVSQKMMPMKIPFISDSSYYSTMIVHTLSGRPLCIVAV